jgi:hypothetical protein
LLLLRIPPLALVVSSSSSLRTIEEEEEEEEQEKVSSSVSSQSLVFSLMFRSRFPSLLQHLLSVCIRLPQVILLHTSAPSFVGVLP